MRQPLLFFAEKKEKLRDVIARELLPSND